MRKRNSSLYQEIKSLRKQIAEAAQNIYDEWEGEDDPFVGSGGICDEIAREISGIIASNIDNVEIDDYGQEGDDHAAVISFRGDERYVVDIPYWLYEVGGGYSWKKIVGVKFKASDVCIDAI